jgi:hypothetical protein
LYAIHTDNINLVSHYLAKGVADELPEEANKRRNASYKEKHFVLDKAFEAAVQSGSVKMMSFLWNKTPEPYVDLDIVYCVEKAGSEDAKTFLIERQAMMT